MAGKSAHARWIKLLEELAALSNCCIRCPGSSVMDHATRVCSGHVKQAVDCLHSACKPGASVTTASNHTGIVPHTSQNDNFRPKMLVKCAGSNLNLQTNRRQPSQLLGALMMRLDANSIR
jgi:hypothetical protein